MKTILIIEDNLDIIDNTSEILEIAGYSVITATSGKDGINEATVKQPDIILCDILMPQVNGYEVLKLLKKNPNTKNIPFIYVTASAEKSDVERAMKMGANGYVRKPFEVRELMDEINKCIG